MHNANTGEPQHREARRRTGTRQLHENCNSYAPVRDPRQIDGLSETREYVRRPELNLSGFAAAGVHHIQASPSWPLRARGDPGATYVTPLTGCAVRLRAGSHAAHTEHTQNYTHKIAEKKNTPPKMNTAKDNKTKPEARGARTHYRYVYGRSGTSVIHRIRPYIPRLSQLRCTGNGEPRRGSRGLIYHAEARRWSCSSASCCASPTMGWRTTTSPMDVPAHLRAGSGLRSLRPLASRAPSVPRAPSAAHAPQRTG